MYQPRAVLPKYLVLDIDTVLCSVQMFTGTVLLKTIHRDISYMKPIYITLNKFENVLWIENNSA